MNHFIQLILKFRNLSEVTIKNYDRGLNKLQMETTLNNAEFITKWSEVLNHIINSSHKEPYKLNILNFYIVVLDSYIKQELYEFNNVTGDIEKGLVECRKLQSKIKESLDILKYNEMKTPKEESNWVSFEDLEKCVKTNFKSIKKISNEEHLDSKTIKKIHMWLISAIYSAGQNNPPLRLDFGNMIIISKVDYDNYPPYSGNGLPQPNFLVILNQRTKWFVLNDYKTVKKYGTKTILLYPKLNTVINKYLKIKNTANIYSNLLLFNNKFEPLSESLMSSYIGDAFISTGKKITANLIRHIFITEIALNLPLAARMVIASRMCHDISQQLCYNKINPPSDE